MRRHIRELCAQFDCSMRDLPAAAGMVEPDEAEETFAFRPGSEP